MELFKLYQNFFTSYIQFLHSGSQSIPWVYGLLPDTRQATYTSFLQTLKQADATLNPGTVSTDYEKAATNAFHAVIPDTRVQGCLYCLSHCAYYRVQAHRIMLQTMSYHCRSGWFQQWHSCQLLTYQLHLKHYKMSPQWYTTYCWSFWRCVHWTS